MRAIPSELVTALETGTRRPAYKLLAYDINQDTLSAVVCGEAAQVPFDLTPYCGDITWGPDKLSFTLSDPKEDFHPDTGQYKQYLADRAVIRLLEGDLRVDESMWIWSFTGQIHGQVGWNKNRSNNTLQGKVSVFSRDNNQAYKRRKVTSDEYTVGTDIGAIAQDFCEKLLGLTDAESRLPAALGLQIKHNIVQLVQVTPWDGLTTMLQAVSCEPFFDGEGKLAYYSKDLTKATVRTLADWVRVYSYEVPEYSADIYNKVRVVFLDSNLEQVDGESQKLGSAQVTTGFFSMGEELDCWWSDDHKQRAKNTYMQVIKSVNSGLLPVGSESYEEVDEYHGKITVAIDVWVPLLASAMLLAYLALSYKPDGVSGVTAPADGTPGHFHALTPPMTPTEGYGRYVQAACLMGILLIMMSIGSAQYDIYGTPYDVCYVEKQSIAMEDGLESWELAETKIDNDFLGSFTQADAVAMTELI